MQRRLVRANILCIALGLLTVGCSLDPQHGKKRRDVVAPAAAYAVEIVRPTVLKGLPIGPADVHGQATVTPCATCHGGRDAGALPESARAIKGPHAGLALTHGGLRCAACHDPEARDRLRLADGRTLPLTEAMQLCAQCHGPQKTNYDHGAHGGMRGHWDLSVGPRERNHCVACHNPHAPAFGQFLPVAGPRDRFTESARGGHNG